MRQSSSFISLVLTGVLSALISPLAAATAVTIPHSGHQVRFVSPDFASTGGTLPQHTSVGDFDGDGHLDAVTVNKGPIPLFGKGVGVSLGDGSGRLGRTVTTNVGSGYGACDLAVGDWNGDAMDDLVVISCVTSGPGEVVAFVATGGGHFARTQTWTGANVQLVVGDFNRDGKPDFVTSELGSPHVASYLGRGDGTFRAPSIAKPPFDSYDLETADVDNDGSLDLIGADGGPIWTMLGKGNGTFGGQIFRFSQVLTGLELTVADFNNDGDLDVAAVDASGGHVGVGLGTGDGRFADGEQISLGSVQALWIAAGTVTHDGNVDLTAGLDNDSTVSALLTGRGDGSFAKATHWVVGADGLTTADFNTDGRSDLLTYVTSGSVGRAYVSLAAGGGFRAARLTRGPLSRDLVDVNGDGVIDKVSGTTGVLHGTFRSQVMVQLGVGEGTFGRVILSHVRNETVFSKIADIDVADINGDGVPDVVGGFDNFDASPNNLFWTLGRGDGSFRPATLSDVGDTNADVTALAASDVNGDGNIDIVANDQSELVARLGRGNGTFAQPLRSGNGSRNDRSVLVADFTGDGIVDVVTTVQTGTEDVAAGQIRLQKGAGDGTFTLNQFRVVDSNLASGTQADLNGDGRPDIVTAGTGGFDGGRNALWVLLTTPGGLLGTPTPYIGPYAQVDTADLDLDGDEDIATTAFDTVDMYLNDGSGAFPRVTGIIAAGDLGGVADLNGDDSPDVMSGSPFGEFAMHLNAR